MAIWSSFQHGNNDRKESGHLCYTQTHAFRGCEWVTLPSLNNHCLGAHELCRLCSPLVQMFLCISHWSTPLHKNFKNDSCFSRRQPVLPVKPVSKKTLFYFFCWNLCKCFEICAYIYWSQQRTVFKQPLLPHSIASERSEQAFHFDQPFLLPGTFHWQWVCIPCCHGNRQIWLADPRELLEFLIKWLSGFFSFWWYCCLTAGIQPHKDPLITVAISLRHVLMAIQSWMC